MLPQTGLKPDMARHGQTCPNFSRHVQTCPDSFVLSISWHVWHVWTKSDKFGNLHTGRFGRVQTSLDVFIQTGGQLNLKPQNIPAIFVLMEERGNMTLSNLRNTKFKVNRNKLVVKISMWNTLRTSFWLKHILIQCLFMQLFLLSLPTFLSKMFHLCNENTRKKITFYIFQYLFYWIFFYNWRKCSRVPPMLVSQNRRGKSSQIEQG